jgi:hypothetical protein
MKTKMTKEQIQENAPSVFTKGPSSNKCLTSTPSFQPHV